MSAPNISRAKREKYLLQVGEANVLVNVESLNLMEEAVCTCRNGLIPIYTARAKHSDWWLMSGHIVSLVVRSVTAEEHVLGHIHRVASLYEERILHITGWMVGCKVEHRKHVLVVVYLWPLIECESHAGKDIYNLIFYNR